MVGHAMFALAPDGRLVSLFATVICLQIKSANITRILELTLIAGDVCANLTKQ